MRALFDDAPGVHDHQPVHARDRTQAVGDGDHGLALHQGDQLLLDCRFDLAVQRRGCLVEDQNRRILEQHPRQRDPLALTARQLDAAFSGVRVVAGPAHPVAQIDDERVRVGPERGLADLLVRGFGTPVADVGRDRAMQQRGVLRHHADGPAQAFLRHVAQVLPVDQDAPALHVVEPQQQVDEGRLAGARTADQAHALTGANVQVQILEHGASALGQQPVTEIHLLEMDVALRHRERVCLRPIHHRVRYGNGLDAFLHDTDILENARDLPTHPARHVGDLPDQRQTGGNHRRCDQPSVPQPQADSGRCDHQQRIERRQRGHETGRHAHMRGKACAVCIHRLAHIGIFLPGAREQLDRHDVGVAVHDPSHHHRARLAAGARQVAHAGHEKAQEEHETGQPEQHRQGHSPVERQHHRQRADAVDHDVPDRAHRRHHAFAQRMAGVHHAVGQPSGKIVLKKRTALAHHVPVALPAHQGRDAGNHRVVAYHAVEQDHQRAPDQQHQRDAQQHRCLRAQGLGRVGGRHQADDAADENRHQRIDQRDPQTGRQHGQIQATRLAHEVPVERQQARRWA